MGTPEVFIFVSPSKEWHHKKCSWRHIWLESYHRISPMPSRCQSPTGFEGRRRSDRNLPFWYLLSSLHLSCLLDELWLCILANLIWDVGWIVFSVIIHIISHRWPWEWSQKSGDVQQDTSPTHNTSYRYLHHIPMMAITWNFLVWKAIMCRVLTI